MRRIYRTGQDVYDHMDELIAARRPFIASDPVCPADYIGIPIRRTSGDMLICVTLQFANGEMSDGYPVEIDPDEFQQCDWRPIDLPEEQWIHLLPQKR